MARILPRPLGLIVLGTLACAGPASAADAPPNTDSQLRALSGSDAARAADPSALRDLSQPEDRDRDPAARTSATPLLRPDSADAAGVSRALAAGNRASRQLVTPEEDDAGRIGAALLAIAGLVLAVILLGRFVGNSRSG